MQRTDHVHSFAFISAWKFALTCADTTCVRAVKSVQGPASTMTSHAVIGCDDVLHYCGPFESDDVLCFWVFLNWLFENLSDLVTKNSRLDGK